MNKMVSIEIVKALELDPNKNYIIEVDVRSGLSHDDISRLHQALHERCGFKGVIVTTKTGNTLSVRELPTYTEADLHGHGANDWPEQQTKERR